MTIQEKTPRCPACLQVLRPENISPDDRGNRALGEELADIIADVDAWAEGDVVAGDGITLDEFDLLRRVAAQIKGPLMRFYRERFAAYESRRPALMARIDEEARDVALVLSGAQPASRHHRIKAMIAAAVAGETGAELPPPQALAEHPANNPRKTHCKWGHLRSADNLTSSGGCRTCNRARAAKSYRDQNLQNPDAKDGVSTVGSE